MASIYHRETEGTKLGQRSIENLDLSASIQPNGRAFRAIVCFLVPELDALYHPASSAQVQWPRRTAGIYYLAELHFLVRSIAEVNYHAVKVYRCVVDANLQLPKGPFGTSQRNLVVIGIPVDVLVTQMNPVLGIEGLA